MTDIQSFKNPYELSINEIKNYYLKNYQSTLSLQFSIKQTIISNLYIALEFTFNTYYQQLVTLSHNILSNIKILISSEKNTSESIIKHIFITLNVDIEKFQQIYNKSQSDFQNFQQLLDSFYLDFQRINIKQLNSLEISNKILATEYNGRDFPISSTLPYDDHLIPQLDKFINRSNDLYIQSINNILNTTISNFKQSVSDILSKINNDKLISIKNNLIVDINTHIDELIYNLNTNLSQISLVHTIPFIKKFISLLKQNFNIDIDLSIDLPSDDENFEYALSLHSQLNPYF